MTNASERGILPELLKRNGPLERQKLLKKVLDKRDEVLYNSNVPPEGRAPCKLNNVTKRKHQTERWTVRNHRKAAKSCRTWFSQLLGLAAKNEAMTNSSIKIRVDYGPF